MRRAGLLLLVVLWMVGVFSDVEAQRRRRRHFNNYGALGLSLGIAHYQGDLDDNGFDWWNVFVAGANNNVGNPFKLIRPGLGADFEWHFHPNLYLGLAFRQGWIGADDSKMNKTYDPRRLRNLNFTSHITEFSAYIGYEFYKNERHWRFRPDWSPFVFAGIAVFNFNPKATPEESWFEIYPELETRFGIKPNSKVPLKPLGTEGQYLNDPNDIYPEPYSTTQISIPIGAGVRWKLAERWDLRFFIGLRKTFTDYLDDVSSQLYPDPLALLASNKPEAALFSDRSFYTDFGNQIAMVMAGILPPDQLQSAYKVQQAEIAARGETSERRGQPNQLDWYAFTGFTLTYILSAKERCPRFRFRR